MSNSLAISYIRFLAKGHPSSSGGNSDPDYTRSVRERQPQRICGGWPAVLAQGEVDDEHEQRSPDEEPDEMLDAEAAQVASLLGAEVCLPRVANLHPL